MDSPSPRPKDEAGGDFTAHFAEIARRNLDDYTIACLGHGPHSSTRPILKLIDVRGQKAVAKDFSDGGSLARGAYGAWMVRREFRAYDRLRGVEGVPRFVKVLDRHAFLIEHVDGEAFRGVTGLSLPGRYFEELRRVVASMHDRGVVHLDLHQRKNFMIHRSGKPFVIDFGSAFVFGRAAKWNPIFLVGRWLDRRALQKLEKKYRRDWGTS